MKLKMGTGQKRSVHFLLYYFTDIKSLFVFYRKIEMSNKNVKKM